MIHPKVKAGSAAAAVSGIIVWALGKYVLKGQVDPTVTAEIYVLVPAVLTFAAGWLTPGRQPPPGRVTVNVTAGTEAQEMGRKVVEAVREYEQASGGVRIIPAAPAADERLVAKDGP
jgi:hypothetical protein